MPTTSWCFEISWKSGLPTSSQSEHNDFFVIHGYDLLEIELLACPLSFSNQTART